MPRRSVSPSTVLATIALFLAIAGGSAIALKGRNSVDSGDIRNGVVGSRDLRDAGIAASDLAAGSVTGAAIADEAVGGGEVADASLSGADLGENSVGAREVDEGSLQIDQAVSPISLRVPAGTNVAVLFDTGGLRLAMDCGATGAVSLFRTNDAGALTEPGGTEIYAAGNDTLLLPVANDAVVSFNPTYRRDSDGRIVRAEITFVTRNGAVGTDCLAMGTVATG